MSNFTLEEWQQAKRIGKDPGVIKTAFQDAWNISDSKVAFTHALAERGYHVAKRDRRGFVAVDAVADEVYSIPKWSGQKTKSVRERMGSEDRLPTIGEVRQNIAATLKPKLSEFEKQVVAKDGALKASYRREVSTLV